MYEIELKAHVADRKALTARLDSIAKPAGAVERHDTYWGRDAVKVRIRREVRSDGSDILVTYKRKEVRTADDGTALEVNDEQECTVSDAKPLESLLTDAGFAPVLRKDKSVIDWTCSTPCGNATLELCTVPPLGDFLELEILSPANDEAAVTAVRSELMLLLTRCGISAEAIESRYYSEMLAKDTPVH